MSSGTLCNANVTNILHKVREQGIISGLITNGFMDLQSAKIDRLGLRELIDEVVISERDLAELAELLP